MRKILLMFFLCLCSVVSTAQIKMSQFGVMNSAPTSNWHCSDSDLTYIIDSVTKNQYDCENNIWTLRASTDASTSYLSNQIAGSSTPSGMVIMMMSGTCPMSYTEVSALNGKFLQGTLAANGDVGSTGGNSTITPSGTVSVPIFTGSQVTSSATSAGTPAGTNATATTGATSAGTPAGTVAAITATATSAIVVATGVGNNVANNIHTHPAPVFTGSALATHTHTVPAEVFTGSALATHTHTVTATGTVSQPLFVGVAIDPRPQFVKVIFCSKN